MSDFNRSIGQWIKMPVIVVVIAGALFAVPVTRHAILNLFSQGGSDLHADAFYTCPMHPEIRLSQMGDCPICGMSLVERQAGSDAASGVVTVSPQQVQLSGLTVEALKPRELAREIDAHGKIDFDETRLEVVSAWVGGRINRLYVDFTGVTVNKGHALVDLYSPDLISTKREYVIALENLAKIEQSGYTESIADARNLVSSTRQRLLWLGLNESQIEQIAESKDVDADITIFAPQGGTVIEKRAYTGMYVKEGDVLFRIADLRRVWIYADIYEDEIPYLYQERSGDYYECTMHPEVMADHPGTCHKCGMDLTKTNKEVSVEIQTRAFPGDQFQAYISFTDPVLNPETRTVRVRLNIDNPDLKLKPAMYARAKIKLPLGEMLAVPENAVIHSGTRYIVLVEEGAGKFRPQPVKLGRMWLTDTESAKGDDEAMIFNKEALRYHEVLAGLDVGDPVVTSGNFLLSSESQLQGALANMIADDEADDDAPEATTDSKDTGATPDEAETTPKVAYAEEPNFAAMLDAYLIVSSKLAADSADGVAELAKTIHRNATTDVFKNASTALQKGAEEGGLKIARRRYFDLSNLMIAYIDQHQSHIEKLPKKAYCPMADASWLQTSDVIANPYYGSSMLECGGFQAWVE